MMDDKKLHNLKNMTPPSPSQEAKKAALSAARHAFEQEVEGAVEQKLKNFQGKTKRVRLTDMLVFLWKECSMAYVKKRNLYQGGAFLALGVLCLGVPVILSALPEPRSDSHDGLEALSKTVSSRGEGNSFSTTNKVPSIIETAVPEVAVESLPSSIYAFARKQLFEQDHASLPKVTNPSIYALPHRKLLEQDNVSLPKVTDQSQFEGAPENKVKLVREEPVSTFSIDVDTASYGYIRRSLETGGLPKKDTVRIEEMVNYFNYDYPLPESVEAPFQPTVSIYPTPWNDNTKLMHIGIKAYDVPQSEAPQVNLVLLLDVSGSMSSPDKLPLLIQSFKMMVDHLRENDVVSIVTYAGFAGTALEPTRVAEKEKIFAALDLLSAGGSTAGATGIQQAYALAKQNYKEEGVNRVILATDGDFNVGTRNKDALQSLIEQERKSGIMLSVLGVGQGNYNDALMQRLAQNGNGTAAYIDTLVEAEKVLVQEAGSTLFTVAKDVKIQVEFNPNKVAEYRLIGYETRNLNREDFNNDAVDAGDIGSGHAVTAIYEITPTTAKVKQIDSLRYDTMTAPAEELSDTMSHEYGFVKIRYKLPKEDTSRLISMPVTEEMVKPTIQETSADVQFATAVAGFGQLLRHSPYVNRFDYQDVLSLAKEGRGADKYGYRSEFLKLVRLAKALD